MKPHLYVQIVGGLLMFIFFIVNPLIFVAIGYLAWNGKPRTFDRLKYGKLAFATFVPGCVLVLCGKWINADVRTLPYVAQVICILSGLLLVGAGCGCAAGFITYRQQKTF